MKYILLLTMVLAGCLATENRKVERTSKTSDVASVASANIGNVDSRTSTNLEKENLRQFEMEVDADLKFFLENTLRWPKTMRVPVKPASKKLSSPSLKGKEF